MNRSQLLIPMCALLSLAACQCTVNPDIDPNSIVIEPTSLTLIARGQPGALTAHRVSGEDVTSQVTWISGDQTLARVEGGMVSGLSAGTLQVSATLDQFTAGADVSVNEGCIDGQKDGDETDVDCGGRTCGPCSAGGLCVIGADCASASCIAGVCAAAASCGDGVRNGSESATDCGGRLCPACGTGETCNGNNDCASRVCTNGLCAAGTCFDGVRNGAETGADCGGPDCARCAAGQTCTTGSDCASTFCIDGKCQASSCTDGVRNGGETDRDCGGPDCAACAPGGACSRNADCTGGVCTNGFCQAASCGDGVINGSETDIDCGGTCRGCDTGGGCLTATDCSSGRCEQNICAGPTCTDTIRNGEETDIDCGGPVCRPCSARQGCTIAADCESGVCNGGICQGASCTDGIENGLESDRDCGGPICASCGEGQTCVFGSDCAAGVCTTGLCQAATCADAVRNGMETGVDCGGPNCASCPAGTGCTVAGDCATGVCTAGLCQAATCSDAVKNGLETAVDCGGSTCSSCAAGEGCTVAADCASGLCTAGQCQAATCTDAVRNGSETAVDCGGPNCSSCAAGQGCSVESDCTSGVCTAGVCQGASCTDGVKNGTETAVDCGGGCSSCAAGQGCTVASDCLTGVCSAGQCQAATCTDAVRNGTETAVDCGGSECPHCAAGQGCSVAGDCITGVCTAGQCQSATCTDTVKNGAETDIDCGGGTCPVCANGGGCTSNTDCSSLVCGNGTCVTAACTDGVRNGQETGVDCGGPDCANCAAGQGCSSANDCASGVCTGGTCRAPSCTDGVKNGLETAIDCGGGTCVGCGSGLTCGADSDCASGNCASGSCGPAVMRSLAVTPATSSVALGRTQDFTALATLSDGSTVDLTQSATWASTNTATASISSVGVLQSHALGTTTVQATSGGLSSKTVVVTVAGPALERIELTPVGVQLPIGLVQAYEATGTFSDRSIADVTASVTWSSSASAVASISASGVATGLSAGSTNVIASAQGVTGQTALVVTNVSVTSISVSPATLTLPAGVRAAYSATALLSDGTARDVTGQASWRSSSPATAQVSSTSPTRGLVTAASAGTATISATLAGNTGSGVLTVINVSLNTIQVFPADETVPRGFSLQYGAVGLYSDGNAYDLTLTATWRSTTASVASVSNTFPDQGVVNTLAVGTTQIEATLGTRSGATSLRVTNAQLTGLSITPALLTLPIGAPRQYLATGVFDDGTARDVTALVRWSSSNMAVASISNAASSRGLLMTLAAGTATITATLGTEVASSALRVTSATLEQLIVSPPTPRIGLQGVVSFVATAVYTDGTGLDVTQLSAWTSSNTNIATVRNDTGFRGVTVGRSSGTVTIGATFGSASASASLKVTYATLDSLSISPAVVRTGIGIDVQFYVSGYWSDGTTGDLTRVATWTSSLSSVAVISNAVSSEGLATTRGQGVTTIRATWAGVEDTTTLTVTNAALQSITVTPATTMTGIGIEVQYRARAGFSDGTTFDVTTNAAWTSSSATVASISGAAGSIGRATALSGGTTTITARMGAISGSATLNVSSAPLTGITVTPVSGIIPVGYWRPYTATARFDDGLAVDVTGQATWTTGTPTVAHAGNGSLYGGRVTGLTPGTSTVVARFGGLGGTATAIVMNLRLVDLVVTPQDAHTPVGVPIQLTATATFSANGTTIELDITLQVGWQVSPRKNGTVSNTDGSRAMVTMYNGSSSAIFHAQPLDITIGSPGDAHTKVSSP